MIIETFLLNYSYLAVFTAALFIGETSVMAAGFLAHQGYLRLDLVILVVTVSAFLGDQTTFLIGRWAGLRYLERRPKWQPRIGYVRRLMFRYGYTLILGFRFITVIHAFIPPIVGALGFDLRRFTALNAFGAVAWAVVNTMAGYLFGLALGAFIKDLHRYEAWVIAGLIALGLLAGAIVSYRLQRMRRNSPTVENCLEESCEETT